MLDRIGSRTAGVGHTTNTAENVISIMPILLSKEYPTKQLTNQSELVDIGKEQLQWRNERGYNDYAYGGQWGNYATPSGNIPECNR